MTFSAVLGYNIVMKLRKERHVAVGILAIVVSLVLLSITSVGYSTSLGWLSSLSTASSITTVQDIPNPVNPTATYNQNTGDIDFSWGVPSGTDYNGEPLAAQFQILGQASGSTNWTLIDTVAGNVDQYSMPATTKYAKYEVVTDDNGWLSSYKETNPPIISTPVTGSNGVTLVTTGTLDSTPVTQSYSASVLTPANIQYGTWTYTGVLYSPSGQPSYQWSCSLGAGAATTADSPPPAADCSQVISPAVYYCPQGGSLVDTECFKNIGTSYSVKFSWTASTSVPNVQVVKSSSCTSGSWSVIATVPDNDGSYTVEQVSSSEYYGVRPVNGSLVGLVSACTQG
jgi:hypothetical protein